MPELPEVETIRRQLEPSLVGASVVGAAVVVEVADGHVVAELVVLALLTIFPSLVLVPMRWFI